jgi:predicted RNase H-like nuclease
VSGRGPAIGGTDGCPRGWILVVRGTDGTIASHLCADAGELMSHARALAALAIDIPIGIPEAGARSCDVPARRALGVRGSSVFPAPVRAALGAVDYRDASDRSFAAHGKRLSKQAFNIIPKIREVDLALRADPGAAGRVHEVHPELSFMLLNGGEPMPASKRTADGRRDRRALIDREFPGAFAEVRARHARREAKDDDLLDAFAALWSAGRIERGLARAFPEGEPARDACGLPMVIKA